MAYIEVGEQAYKGIDGLIYKKEFVGASTDEKPTDLDASNTGSIALEIDTVNEQVLTRYIWFGNQWNEE